MTAPSSLFNIWWRIAVYRSNLVSDSIIQMITSKNSAQLLLSLRILTILLSTSDKQWRYALSVNFFTGNSVCQTHHRIESVTNCDVLALLVINIRIYQGNINLSNKQHRIRLRHQLTSYRQICMKPKKETHHHHHSSVPRTIWHLNTSKDCYRRMPISGWPPSRIDDPLG